MDGRRGHSKWLLVVVVMFVAALILVQGCKKKTPPAPEAKKPAPQAQTEQVVADTQKVADQASAEVVAAAEQTTCPVMDGNPINKDLYVEYQGKKVYFCCAGCEEKFNADPEKYIAKLPQFK